MNGGPGKRSIVYGVLLSTVAVLSAAAAAADPTDDAFVATLAKRGIVITDSNTTIATAHSVCDGLQKHYKSSVLAVKLVRDTDLSLSQSGYFIGVAVSAYCPQFAGRPDPSAYRFDPGLR
jgi:hypothetical protein